MINYCCSRCGEKVPTEHSYQVDITEPHPIDMLKQTKSYILCLACSVELECWMEEDAKEADK